MNAQLRAIIARKRAEAASANEQASHLGMYDHQWRSSLRDQADQATADADELEAAVAAPKEAAPRDAGDPTYPTPEGIAQTLERCEEDLITEARYVRWMGRELARLAAPSKEAGADIGTMVNRFLCWKLPQDFHPDAGISFTPYDPPEHPHMRDLYWPVGTNLLTADQAKAMFTHCLASPCPIDGLTEPHVGMDPPHQYIANPPGDQRQEGETFWERHHADMAREAGLSMARTAPGQYSFARTAQAAPPPTEAAAAVGEYQERVGVWMDQCFPRALYGDMTQRCDRFLEESLELLQAMGYDRGRVATLVDYVWNRPVGHAPQEVGGTVVTLAALCWVAGIDMQGEADRELARIEQPEVMAKIQAKQQAKNALHFDSPLPGNAAMSPTASAAREGS